MLSSALKSDGMCHWWWWWWWKWGGGIPVSSMYFGDMSCIYLHARLVTVGE